MHYLLVFLGAGLGGISRYWVSNGIHLFLGRQFPFGTLVVNATGCFLTGLLFTIISKRFGDIGPQLRALLLIGFLGGYTTFSSFSLETLNLLENGAWWDALLNIMLNVFLCVGLSCLGVLGGRQF